MNILAFDTSLGACSAAVLRRRGEEAEVFSRFELREREHAEVLIPMIGEVLDEAGLAYADMSLLAGTVGPGSFTGVRVGISALRGFALALDLPVVGLTSLDVMAATARDKFDAAPDRFAIAVDARRGEVYLGLYDADAKPLGDPAALSPADAAAVLLAKECTHVAGSGAGLVQAQAPGLSASLPDLQPDAAMLVRLAADCESSPEPLKPLYLRPPDAKPQAGKALPAARPACPGGRMLESAPIRMWTRSD